MKDAYLGLPFVVGGLLILVVFLLAACTTQNGKSVDYVYGYDTGMLWNHLYLKDDHTTTYCYESSQSATFTPIFDTAIKEGRKVQVEYAKYPTKGALCVGTGETETVVVIDVVLQ